MILSPFPKLAFLDNNGRPLVGGLLFTYVAGTSTKLATYADESGGSTNTNPIVLDYRGEANVWLDPELAYKFVLAHRTDTDPPTNPIWSVDDIAAGLTLATLTQQLIGGILWPRTQREIDAGVTPVRYYYQPGNVFRYGATGDGVTDDVDAFADAVASNDLVEVPEPDASYLFNSELEVDVSDISIVGASKRACRIVLSSAAGASAAAFSWNAYAENVFIQNIGVYLKNAGLNQRGFRFEELRSSRLLDLWIEGIGTSSDDTTAIQFNGTGTFTGDVTVERCYITNHLVGVDLQGTCTSVRVVDCELYATSGVSQSKGVKIANTCVTTLVMGCTFDQWERGVYSEGAYIRQIANYFESNDPQWEWVRGSGNARIWAQSFGDVLLGSGTPTYPINDVDACMVFSGPGTVTADNTTIAASRGYTERLRTTPLGDWTTPTFDANDYTGSGSMTWTVDSGDVTTMAYTLIGTTMIVSFFLVNTTVGGTPSSTLQIAIPGGYSGVKRMRTPINVLNNATQSTGLAEVQASQTDIYLYVDFAASNWVAGATDVYGQITFEVA
jgi:hypothetical protein